MAQRTVALCDNEYIGIETIFRINELGEKINIPEKLAYVRSLSQAGKLFCPCGCGANLVLVAGEKMLREQHFRIKDDEEKSGCSYVAEGPVSIRSKIDLKSWLECKVGISDIQTRFQQKNISETNDRKYELTFFSRNKKLAICYWKNFDIGAIEKFTIIKELTRNLKLYYIVDESNSYTVGQYPEMMMKIQEIQGFCLFLNCTNDNYKDTVLRAAFYTKNARGRWEEVTFAKNNLDNWNINDKNELLVGDSLLLNMLGYQKKQHEKKFQADKKQIEKEDREREIRIQKARAERDRLEHEVLLRELAEAEARKKALEERRKEEEENMQKWAQFHTANYGGMFDQQETQVRINGIRYVKCEICGMVKQEDEFATYGGVNHVNLGKCNICMRAKRKN